MEEQVQVLKREKKKKYDPISFRDITLHQTIIFTECNSR